MRKLAIITTHPIQYNAPLFQLLCKRNNIQIKVFYTWSQTQSSIKDPTFGKEIIWDIPLLEGYDFEFVENKSKNPGSNHFFGIDCPTLIEKIKSYSPNALLFFGWNLKSHLHAIYYFSGKVPIWFRGDSTLLDEKSDFKTFLRRSLLNKVYSYIDKAFYVGEANRSYFLKHGVKSRQLIYAPHAIDNERFADYDLSKYEQKVRQWRQELGFKEDDLVVLFAGKFENKKQPEFLLEAFKKANALRIKPLKLLMVGSGPLELKLKENAKNTAHIHFLPFQNQTKMPLVYRMGSILCLPSKGPGESWGLSINEAMACGKPVIVSDRVGCSIDLVKDFRNGYCFNSQDQSALVQILQKLALDNLKRLGVNAMFDIRNYNFNAISITIENEINDL